MRDWTIAFISLILILLSVKIIKMDMSIQNLERQLKHVEDGYNEVLAENERMERLTDQTLWLMTERGGWE